MSEDQHTFPFASMESEIWRRLFEQRTVYLRGPIHDTVADTLAAQLMSLDAEGPQDVNLYINSPGGDAAGMFAIYDVIALMRARVNTLCVGLAASAGAFLLATGTGVRAATENARILIHQPLGAAQGQSSDIQIQARQIAYLRERQNEILAERTGKSVEEIARDVDRDFWLSAEEAVAYGLIDEVRSADRGVLRPVRN